MGKLSFFTEVQLQDWLAELEECQHQLLHAEIQLDRTHLLPETEVCKLLGVTERTMRRYRKKKYLRYIKLDGRIFYLKVLLYIDLVLRSMEE